MYISRERKEEALQSRSREATLDITETDGVTDAGQQPDAVVNLTFDADGQLVDAKQERHRDAAPGSASNTSAKFAIRNSAAAGRSSSGRERSAGSGARRGMKPLSKAEQRDLEELEREEKYQRDEQKKIQVRALVV